MARLIAALPAGTLSTGDPVLGVSRDNAGVTIRTASRPPQRFDAVVLASHADDALRMLGDADDAERAALAGFDYTPNQVVLHTDERVMPRRPNAWASWNVEQPACATGERGHDDVPHEPPAVASRPRAVLRVAQPRRHASGPIG